MAHNSDPKNTRADDWWKAVVSRDRSFDECFVYAVVTTRVYCRPHCASRQARPENVRFFADPKAAEIEGFRACKRCKPNLNTQPDSATRIIAELCRLIESADSPPHLEDLAKIAGWSTYHLHRKFKSFTGLTPHDYGRAHRARRVREALHAEATVTDAIYGAGYSSSGRFYEESHQILGMVPSSYKTGGTGAQIQFALGQCTLGAILVAATSMGICEIALDNDPHTLLRNLQDRFANAELIGGNPLFESWVAHVVALVEEPKLGINLPLDIRGTAFQKRVWEALTQIPLGQTRSYSEIAEFIGAPKSVRAVAKACAANHLAVAIPCHRVVRRDGSLSGYRWGIERKRALLERESPNTAPNKSES